MQIKIFTIPTGIGGEESTEEMNTFLRSVRVLEISKEFVMGALSFWTFCITYLPTQGEPSTYSGKREKIDYKSILSEQEFERFSILRKIRKQIADNDAVPPYAVFLDSELAEIAKHEKPTEQILKAISGIGAKKVSKYGISLCNLYSNAFIPESNETSGQSVE